MLCALSIKPSKEAACVCGGRGLWEFNRFGAGSHCNEWSYAKSLIIDARQCTAPSVHPGDGTPRRFFFQAQIRLPYTRGSVRRASGFVLTGNPEVTVEPGVVVEKLGPAKFAKK